METPRVGPKATHPWPQGQGQHVRAWRENMTFSFYGKKLQTMETPRVGPKATHPWPQGQGQHVRAWFIGDLISPAAGCGDLTSLASLSIDFFV